MQPSLPTEAGRRSCGYVSYVVAKPGTGIDDQAVGSPLTVEVRFE